MRAVPPGWLAQTRPGGLILAPWGTRYSDQDALVGLRVGRDGQAHGRFLRMAEFMKLREPTARLAAVRRVRPGVSRGRQVRFVPGLCVPGCAHVVNRLGDGSAKAWFFDLGSRSWAVAEFPDGESGGTVRQSGPRTLWDEAERALEWWVRRGRPALGRFGVTVGSDGSARPWLDDPAKVLPTG